MKKNFHALGKRALALLIVLTMCVSLLQVTAFAAPGDETTAESVGDVVQQPKETTEPETKDPVEETTEPETKDPAEETTEPETKAPVEETTEPETKAPVEETTEPETKAPVEETTEPEIKAPVENATESETKAPVKDVTETKTEPVVVMKPAASAAPVLTTPAGAISYIVNALTTYKVGDKCPECPEGTVVADKSNPNHLICDKCAKFSFTIQGTEPEPEKCKHENGFDGYDRCVDCKALNPNHKHSYDETGKCVCGDQHEHDWKYTPEHYEYFTHTKYCSSCGEKVKEACIKEKVYDPWAGQYVYKCTLCNYWSEPVDGTHQWTEVWEPNNEGYHIMKCKDPDCEEVRKEECKPEVMADGKVVCPTCGWVKYDDGKPGIDDQCKDGHTLGNVYTSNGDYSHSVECMVCHTKVTQRCELDILYIDGKPVTYYCNICGQQKPIYGDGYCTDKNGHQFEETNQVLSADGKSVLTTQTCKICGFVKIQEICHSPSTVIVHYVYQDGTEAAKDYVQTLIAGDSYLIPSPNIDGYTPDKPVVSGKCIEGKGDEITVTYTKTDIFTLTIDYQYPGGEPVFPSVIEKHKAGDKYEVASKDLHGYKPEQAVVKGTMPAADEHVTVKYTPIEYKWTIWYVDESGKELAETFKTTYTVENVKSLTAPANPDVEGYKVKTSSVTVPDSETLGNVEGKVVYMPDSIPTHTLTIKYVFENGQEAFGKHEAQLKKDESYNVPSHELLGYTPDQKVVSVTMPDTDLEITVTYKLDKYTWTINYVDENGNTLFDSVKRDFDVTNIKSLGSVTSPTQKGYTADQPVVNAPTKLDNVEVTVKYTLSADFNLTVIHRYVNRDGTVIEVTQDMVKHQIGDQYTTQPVARSGYTLSATPENATGVFGAQDVTVTYVYTANAPSGGNNGGGTPPVTPNPPEEPNPPVGPDDPIEVPDDPNVPLEPGPGTDDPQEPGPGDDVIIDDPDVPLAPGPDIPDVDIDDPDVPMTNKPTAPAEKNPVPQPTATGLTEIEDEDVPLAEVPQTGDNTGLWIAAAILAACGLVTLGKKREDA